jgi:integrase/recombinase XerD
LIVWTLTPHSDAEAAPPESRLVADYVQYLIVEKGRSRATVEAYIRDIDQFVGWLTSQRGVIERIATSDLERYFAEVRSHKAPSSVARATSAVRGWLGFLAEEQLIPGDVSQQLKPARRGRTLPKPIDEQTMALLLDSFPRLTPVERRDGALMEFLYGTGARVSEVTNLQIQDLDFDEELIRLTGKGSKQRLVPMGQHLREALDGYLGLGGRGEFIQPRPTSQVFLNHRGGGLTRQGVDLIIGRRALEAGVDRHSVSAHVFRHSCATHMLAYGADIRVVQELLGHASIATTQLYTAVSITSLQRAYRDAHPRAVN